jgi:hypothetical protein
VHQVKTSLGSRLPLLPRSRELLDELEPAAGSNPRVLQGPGPAPLRHWAWLPPGGENLAKGTPCRNKLTGRKTPTPQSVLRSSLTTGSTRSGPGGGVEPSDASSASPPVARHG